MPKVKINDIEVEVPSGTNMIEAARQAGVEIPHYCYHPHLSVAGNCRMCLVDIVGGRGPDIACNMQARDGLAIRTDTEAVTKMRKSVMEFLLVNHPLDCPICDQSGECRLQDYYMEYGQYDSRGVDDKVSKKKRQDIGERIMLDAERCVQCSRCVRFGDEVTNTGDLRLMNRGDHTEIGMFPGERLAHNYTGNLADICPVGALTSKEFRFQRRVWYLKEVPSVCSGCATGCNVQVCHQEGQVFRVSPRRNDGVNKSWMCDFGRDLFEDVSGLRRILRASVDGKKLELDAALPLIAARLRSARVGVVLGTQATNEGNWALLQMVRSNLPNAKVFWVEGADAGAIPVTDDLLIASDKNPNTAGVRLIAGHDGKVGDKAALLGALGEIELLLVLQDDVVTRLSDTVLPPIVYLGVLRTPTAERAWAVLPVTHAFEMDGTYINARGRVQRIRRAVNPLGQAIPACAMVDRLGAALGRAPGTAMPTATFNAMAKAIPRMAGIDFKGLGTEGMAIAPLPVAPDAGIGAEAK